MLVEKEGKNGITKVSKIPINPITLHGASISDAFTWSNMDCALSCMGMNASANGFAGAINGIGFVLGDGWAGIDLDGGEAHGKDDVPEPMLNDFLDCGTYFEKSYSGCGYHFVGYYNGDKLTPNAYGHCEMYTGNQYFMITANCPARFPVKDITKAMTALHRKYILLPSEKDKAESVHQQNPVQTDKHNPQPSSSEMHSFLEQNISDILSFLPADCNRTDWIKVGSVLKSEGFDFEYFDNWSKTSPEKYNSSDTKTTWKSLKKTNLNGGYLVKTAMENGWRPKHISERYKNGGNSRKMQKEVSTPNVSSKDNHVSPNMASASEGISFPPFVSGLSFAADLSAQGNNIPKIPTGFPILDKKLNGGFYSGLVVLSGAPSEGKSAFAIQMVANIAKTTGKDILFFSFEMPTNHLVARTLSIVSYGIGVPVKTSDILDSTVEFKKHESRILDAYSNAGAHTLFCDTPSADIHDTIATAESYILATNKVPVIVIDYLQLYNVRNGISTADGFKDITLALKQFAIRHNTVVLAVSSVNRASQSNGISIVSSYGSGFIEYSADYLLCLEFTAALPARNAGETAIKAFRANLDKFKACTDRYMTVSIQKARMSACGLSSTFLFHTPYSAFTEMQEKSSQCLFEHYEKMYNAHLYTELALPPRPNDPYFSENGNACQKSEFRRIV